MDLEFSPDERRALRRMLAWFRSAADSDDESHGEQHPVDPTLVSPQSYKDIS